MTPTITMKLYNAGLEIEDAVAKGANRQEFEAFEKEYKGGSIPLHVLYGLKPRVPYSCDYHTGGAMGAMLREIIKANQ